MKKVLLVFTSLVAGLFLLLAVAAGLADPAHRGVVHEVFPAAPATIWGLLTDTERHSLQRHEVKSVEMLAPNAAGFPVWRENTGPTGDILLQVTGMIPERILKVEMLQSDFGMTGTWTFLLEAEGAGTKVTIVENSRTDGWLMRGILALIGRNGNLGLQLRTIHQRLSSQQ